MSADAPVEAPSPSFTDESVAPAFENAFAEPPGSADSELLALADEYSGVVFEWGAYKGTSHEILQRCPWAQQAGAIALRAVFEAGRANSNTTEEIEEEKQEEVAEEQPKLQEDEKQTSLSESQKLKEAPMAKHDTTEEVAAEQVEGNLSESVSPETQLPTQRETQDRPATANETAQVETEAVALQEAVSAESPTEATARGPESVDATWESSEIAHATKPHPDNKPKSALAEVKPATPPVEKLKTSIASEKLEKKQAVKVAEQATTPQQPEQQLEQPAAETMPKIKEIFSADTEPPATADAEAAEPEEVYPAEIFLHETEAEPSETINEVEPEIFEPMEIAEAMEEAEPEEADYLLQLDELPEGEDALLNHEIEEPELPDTELISAMQHTELAPEAETVDELPLPVEQVEEAVEELAQFIEDLEDEESLATVHEILDDIAIKIEELRAELPTEESDIEAADVESEDYLIVETTAENELAADKKEELKELFIELFDYAEIEYTPELIESFISLAMREDIAELIAEAEEEEEALVDRGTHEIILQIIKAIAAAKKAAQHAYEIGRSALNLYSQQLALAAA